MFFSEYFEIDPRLLLEYGALDISLVCDLGQFTRNYTQTTKWGLLTTNKG